MFPAEDSIKEWNLLFQTQQQNQQQMCKAIQIVAKYGEKVKMISVLPSTLNGEYFQQLKKQISFAFHIPKNVSVSFSLEGEKIDCENKLVECTEKNAQICLLVGVEGMKKCVLCLKKSCQHSKKISTVQESEEKLKKRKTECESPSSSLPQREEEQSSPLKKKRRFLTPQAPSVLYKENLSQSLSHSLSHSSTFLLF